MNSSINYEKIANQVARLEKVASDIKDILNDVKTSGKSVSQQGMWTGEASNYYYNYFVALSNQFDDICDEVKSSAIFLDNCLQNYKSLDNLIVNSFSGISPKSGGTIGRK